MIKYCTIDKKHNRNFNLKNRFYARIKFNNQISEEMFFKEIATGCRVPPMVAMRIVMEFQTVLIRHMCESNTVHLKMGVFYPSFSSEGAANEKDISSAKIKSFKIIFNTSKHVKEALAKAGFIKVDKTHRTVRLCDYEK